MKINEFLNNVNGKTVEEIEAMIIARKYIPIQEKRMIARDILDRCVDDSNGYIVIDRIDKDILFKIEKLRAYTCLEFSDDYEDMISEYDVLSREYYIDLIENFVIGDVIDFNKVMNCEEDMILEANCINAQVAKVADSLVDAIEVLSEKLNGVIGDFNMNQLIPEGTDVNSLMDMLKKLN